MSEPIKKVLRRTVTAPGVAFFGGGDVRINGGDYDALGSPDTITVTIEAGDQVGVRYEASQTKQGVWEVRCIDPKNHLIPWRVASFHPDVPNAGAKAAALADELNWGEV